MKADVSVIIPYYEAEKTICRALESIKVQSAPVREVIIVNDGSDFGVLSRTVAAYIEVLEIVLVDLGRNFGAANARNAGVARASSRFLAFLDADDIWHNDKIMMQYDFMLRSGAFLTSHGYGVNLDNPRLPAVANLSARRLRLFHFVWKNQIFTPTVMVVRERFLEFDPSLSRSEDLKCWLSNFSNGEFYQLSGTLAGGFKVAVGASGLSGSYRLMHSEYLAAWKKLHIEGYVNAALFAGAWVFENIKYPVRLFFGALRRLR